MDNEAVEPVKSFLNKPMVESTLGDQMIMHASSVVMTIVITMIVQGLLTKKQ